MKLLSCKIFLLIVFGYTQEQYTSDVSIKNTQKLNQAIQSIEKSFFKPNEDPIVDVRFMGDAVIARMEAGKHDPFVCETVLELRRLYYEERESKKPNQNTLDLYLVTIVAFLKENRIIADRGFEVIAQQKKFSFDYWYALKNHD